MGAVKTREAAWNSTEMGLGGREGCWGEVCLQDLLGGSWGGGGVEGRGSRRYLTKPQSSQAAATGLLCSGRQVGCDSEHAFGTLEEKEVYMEGGDCSLDYNSKAAKEYCCVHGLGIDR